MANHDLYEKNLLKALQDIAKSLRSIDSTLKLDVGAAFELFRNVHNERLHKKEVAKAARELDPIVNECPCKKCSDEFRMSCRGCFDYSEWISKLKGE